jgi:hypothetical protein
VQCGGCRDDSESDCISIQLQGKHSKSTFPINFIEFDLANVQIDGGQHDLWCDREGDLKLNGYWNKSKACTEHIVGRNKAKLTAFIMPHLAGVNRRPKYCKQEVVVDHYKFLFGIEAYLRKVCTT